MTERLVGSDETLFRIVENLGETGEMGVTELSNSLDVSKSSIHRHLQTLEAHGYAINVEGRYRLSHQWFHIGTSVQTKHSFYRATKSEIKKLAEETQNTVWCAIEEHGKLMFVNGAGTTPTINPDLLVGRWSPLNKTAAGKAILAYLPDGQINEILSNGELSIEATDNSRIETLLQELKQIRDQGYAVNKGEHITGIYAIGKPVIIRDQIVGAISVANSSDDMLTEHQNEIVSKLSAAVGQVTENINKSEYYFN